MLRPCSDVVGSVSSIGLQIPTVNSGPYSMCRLLAVLIALCTAPFQISFAQAEIVASPRDLAIVRINVIDLLANEPRLPLPIKQRREALLAYYQELGGELVWLGTQRASELVARLRDAEGDGLNSQDYPSKQLTTLIADGSADKRKLAIIELYFSAAFLEYASDLKVGRIPAK